MASNEADPCWCKLCGIRVPGALQMQKHVEGKKHVRMLAVTEARQRHERQSVFVRNFPAGTTEEELGKAFLEVGLVEKIILDKSKEGPKYAIVQFENEDTAMRALDLSEPVVLGGRRLVVKPRSAKPAEKKVPTKTSSTDGVATPQASTSPKETDSGASTTELNPTAEFLDPLCNAASIDDQFTCLVSRQSLGQADLKKREDLASRIGAALKTHAYASSSGVSVELYGSAVTGFGVKASDVDMTVMTETSVPEKDKVDEVTMLDELDQAKLSSAESSFTSVGSSVSAMAMSSGTVQTRGASSGDGADLEAIKSNLDTVAAVLRHHVAGCGRVLTIAKARRPLVRFFNADLSTQCDLTLNNHLAVQNSRLLGKYCQFDPRVSPLVHVVRAWATNRGLCGQSSSSQLTGYSLAIMVVAFLQRSQPPVLPCLQLPPTDPVPGHNSAGDGAASTETTLEGWQCAVHGNHPPGVNFDSLDKLLCEFFAYYGSFDFEQNAVSIHVPLTVAVSDILLTSSQRVDDLTAAGQSDLARLSVFRPSAMSILDPFEFTHNVTAGVGPPLVRQFVDQCRSAALLCQTDWLKQPPPAENAGTPPLWGLAQLVCPSSASCVRFLSVSVTADQLQALSSSMGLSLEDEEAVLHISVETLKCDFGISAAVAIADAGIDVDSDVIAEGDEPESGHDALGKTKKAVAEPSGSAAKRPRTSSSSCTSGEQAAQSRFRAVCEAHTNTWLHRRRWKRELQRRRAAGEDVTLETGTGTAAAVTSPVLAFQLHVLKERSLLLGKCTYSVVFHPAADKFMSELHHLVAVFRKDLLQKLSAT